MKTETLDKIRKLRAASQSLSGFWEMWSAKYASDSHCDKKAARFSTADRCVAFSTNVAFECYAGYYGNSSVGTVPIAPSEIVRPYFIRVLNEQSKFIFARMAEMMLEDAESMTAEAQDEIAAMQAMLAEISGSTAKLADAA